MLEHELSFNFSLEYLPKLDDLKYNLITDYYFDKNSRIRSIKDQSSGESYYISTIKKGLKESGTREEHEAEIQLENESFLSAAKLIIKKKRYELLKNEDVHVILDVVESPMMIGTIEIEFSQRESLDEFLNKFKLNPCELSAWNFHKRRIGIAGGPSSGKTSVAKKISLFLNNNYKANTSDVVEYATSFIQKLDRSPAFEDQSWIYIKQSEREDAIEKTANIVLSDCPVFISWIYATLAMEGKKATGFTDFARESLFKRCVKSLDKYQFIYLLETIDYRENGVRFHNLEASKNIFNKIETFLIENGRSHKYMKCDYSHIDNIIASILYLNNYDEVANAIKTLGDCQI